MRALAGDDLTRGGEPLDLSAGGEDRLYQLLRNILEEGIVGVEGSPRQGHGILVGPKIAHAVGALRQMHFERLALLGGKLAVDVSRQELDDVAARHDRHGRNSERRKSMPDR